MKAGGNEVRTDTHGEIVMVGASMDIGGRSPPRRTPLREI